MFRPSPQQSPAPGMFRPSPQQSPQPSVWPASQAQVQQAFPPPQAFPPQQDFPPTQQQQQQSAFPAQQSFDSPAMQAFPPAQQGLFGSSTSSPFAGGPAQATSTPNQATSAFGEQPQQQQQFGKVTSDPFKDDPFFSSSTPPPSTTTSAQDKYAAFSEDFSQSGGSVFGDSSAFGGRMVQMFENTNRLMPQAMVLALASSTMNNAFGATSPTMSSQSTSPGPVPPQRNASSGNLFQDLDVLNGGGKKEVVSRQVRVLSNSHPNPQWHQLGSGRTPSPGSGWHKLPLHGSTDCKTHCCNCRSIRLRKQST